MRAAGAQGGARKERPVGMRVGRRYRHGYAAERAGLLSPAVVNARRRGQPMFGPSRVLSFSVHLLGYNIFGAGTSPRRAPARSVERQWWPDAAESVRSRRGRRTFAPRLLITLRICQWSRLWAFGCVASRRFGGRLVSQFHFMRYISRSSGKGRFARRCAKRRVAGNPMPRKGNSAIADITRSKAFIGCHNGKCCRYGLRQPARSSCRRVLGILETPFTVSKALQNSVGALLPR